MVDLFVQGTSSSAEPAAKPVPVRHAVQQEEETKLRPLLS